MIIPAKELALLEAYLTGLFGPGNVTGVAPVTDGHLAVFDVDEQHIKDGGPIPSGGGGSDYFNPDIFTPGAYDDHFNTGSLDGSWTIFNSSGYATLVADTNVIPHCLRLISSMTDGTAKMQGVVKALPSTGNWQITTHVMDSLSYQPVDHYLFCGMFVAIAIDGSSGADLVYTKYWNDRFYPGSYGESVASSEWADFDTDPAGDDNIFEKKLLPYLKIVWDGTYINTYASTDGAVWLLMSTFVPSGTPLYGGLFIMNYASNITPQIAAFDWFKVEVL